MKNEIGLIITNELMILNKIITIKNIECIQIFYINKEYNRSEKMCCLDLKSLKNINNHNHFTIFKLFDFCDVSNLNLFNTKNTYSYKKIKIKHLR